MKKNNSLILIISICLICLYGCEKQIPLHYLTIRDNKSFYENKLFSGIAVDKDFSTQKVVSKTKYEEGLKNGYFIVFYNDGSIKGKCNYVKGMLDGIYHAYFENGKLRIEGSYLNNKRNGDWKVFDTDGKIQISGKYKDGVKVGNWEINDENNILKFRNNFDSFEVDTIWNLWNFAGEYKIINKGKSFEAIYKKYNDDGEIWSTGKLTNWKQDSTWTLYLDNNVIFRQSNYKLGRLHGVQRTFFYANVTTKKTFLCAESNFVNGILHGKQYTYSPNGEIMGGGNYINGIKNGYWIEEEFENIFKGTYQNGLKNGTWEHYDEDGKLYSIKNYSNGNPNGQFKSFFHTGSISQEGFFKNSKWDGELKTYFENGNLDEIKTFTRGIRDGIYKKYYSNGKLKESGMYRDGKRNGEWVLYRENGNKISITEYDMGKRINVFRNAFKSFKYEFFD